ncbi:hypothetical protein [Streptomyces albidus (ex Kaewkla and Franco 2022)]|uniref:hypothetical protein n=1 Tax=Streptomyces albidus (ex Kaewkla and Franco 2022) TaxID=722709 RepID=UPI0015EEE189|nr:hypothetical protein [Streptomyces albidus (ex Kaewkla and Franco 2022)]
MSKAAQGASKSRTAGGPTSRSTRSNRSSRGGGASRTARSATSTSTGTATDESAETEKSTEATGAKESAEATQAAGQATAGTKAEAAETTETGETKSVTRPSSADKTVTVKPTTRIRTGTVAESTVKPGSRPYRAPSPAPSRSTSRARRDLRGWLRRVPRWWPLPLCLAIGAVGGGAYAKVTPPQYAAVSYVVVSPDGQSEAAAALGYAQAYGKIATDAVILAEAESDAHLRRGTLREGIQASTSPDAPMVQITATSSSATQAAKNADAVAKALRGTARESVKRTGARLTVLSEAVAPAAPVSPSAAVSISVGACAGGLIGGLVLLTRPQWGRRPSATNVTVPGLAENGDSGARDEAHAGGDKGTETVR